MESLLQVALSNAVVAAALAVLAVAVGRACRRPALTHGLWLLVLLKLVTPPLFNVPLPWPDPVAEPTAVVEPAPPPEPPAELPPLDFTFEWRQADAETTPPAEAVAADDKVTRWHGDKVTEEGLKQPPARKTASDPGTLSPCHLVTLSSFLWLAGTLGWFALAARRVRRFQGLLRFAEPAEAWLQAEVNELASRLGLRRAPRAWLVPGRLSPMLWSLGGMPRLLIPAELLPVLSAEQRATLLLHELAHLRRGDHRVRLLEALATGLYWWHPVVWWARRELREAEEQCCDAWVVWALPGAGRAYATAIVECLDFLSGARSPLPVGASGIGHIADLKRRLTMILGETTPRRLTWSGCLALFALGGLFLPALPTWADEERERDERREERPREKATTEEAERARDEVARLKRELEERLAQVRQAEARLREAAAKLARLEGKEGEKRQIRVIIIGADEKNAAVLDRIRSLKDLKGRIIVRPGDAPSLFPTPTPPRLTVPRPSLPGGGRIRELEKKLDEVMRQLEEMRRQMRERRPETPRREDRRRETPRLPERREEGRIEWDLELKKLADLKTRETEVEKLRAIQLLQEQKAKDVAVKAELKAREAALKALEEKLRLQQEEIERLRKEREKPDGPSR